MAINCKSGEQWYGTCLVTRAGSDGRRNTPLIGWSHNSLQKEPISQAVLDYTQTGQCFL